MCPNIKRTKNQCLNEEESLPMDPCVKVMAPLNSHESLSPFPRSLCIVLYMMEWTHPCFQMLPHLQFTKGLYFHCIILHMCSFYAALYDDKSDPSPHFRIQSRGLKNLSEVHHPATAKSQDSIPSHLLILPSITLHCITDIIELKGNQPDATVATKL